MKGDREMKTLKQKVDAYYDLEGNTEGQLFFYGAIGVIGFISCASILNTLIGFFN